ncbi:MAG: rhodanese-like domain-containing protein [Cypionkella sp.]|nr:rhodanese-like domain-containing protein [Cypionkella sp.]
MTNWAMVGTAALLVAGTLVFLQLQKPKGYEVASPSAKDMAQSKAVIVDIRRPEEWAATGVIKGAKLITFTNADAFLAQLGAVPAGSPLVIICQSGRRSAAAASALAGKVDSPIISYDGGMSAWIAGKGQIARPKL